MDVDKLNLMSPEQLNKLPKYAREEIDMLRRKLGEQVKENEILANTGVADENTGVSVETSYDTPEFNFPAGAGVEFFLKGKKDRTRGSKIRARIKDDGEGGVFLDINADGVLLFEPRASNSAYLWLKP